MHNAYIVDTVISILFVLFILIGFVGVRRKLASIRVSISSENLAMAIGEYSKLSFQLSLPVFVLILFLAWRLYALLLALNAINAGGYGLIAILTLVSGIEVFLFVILTFISNSGFVFSNKPVPINNSKPKPTDETAEQFWSKEQK